MVSRIYQYGLRAPTDWADDMDAHFFFQWRTYNDIIALYRQAREDERAFVRAQDPRLDDLERRHDGLFEDMKAARAADDRERHAAIKREIERLYQEEIKPIRQGVYRSSACRDWQKRRKDDVKAAVKALSNEVDESGLTRAKRLHWGTLNELKKRARQADTTTFATPYKPRFRRLAEMPLGVYQQIQKGTSKDGEGLTVAELEGGAHSQVAMLPGAQDRFRILKVKAYGERYLHFPMVYHRPLPAEARIKEVHVIRTRVARKPRWRVNFILAGLPEPQEGVSDGGAIGIDIGWYRQDDLTRRVLIPRSSLPDWSLPVELLQEIAEVERTLEHVEALQSRRDKLLDDILAMIKSVTLSDAPEAIAERWVSLRRGRRPAAAKVAAMVLRWRREYPDYQPERLGELEAWRHADAQLYEPLSHLRDKAIARRKDAYRNIARLIVDSHSVIAIEKFDLRRVAAVKDMRTGKHNTLGATARAGRVRVALSEFRDTLKWMANDAGVTLVEVVGKTTQTCSECGAVNKLVDPKSREYSCASCGVIQDRDDNAARNLLRVACERSGGAQDSGEQNQRVRRRGWGWNRQRSQTEPKAVLFRADKG